MKGCLVTRVWPGLFITEKNKPSIGPSMWTQGNGRNLRLRAAGPPWGRHHLDSLCLRAWVGR